MSASPSAQPGEQPKSELGSDDEVYWARVKLGRAKHELLDHAHQGSTQVYMSPIMERDWPLKAQVMWARTFLRLASLSEVDKAHNAAYQKELHANEYIIAELSADLTDEEGRSTYARRKIAAAKVGWLREPLTRAAHIPLFPRVQPRDFFKEEALRFPVASLEWDWWQEQLVIHNGHRDSIVWAEQAEQHRAFLDVQAWIDADGLDFSTTILPAEDDMDGIEFSGLQEAGLASPLAEPAPAPGAEVLLEEDGELQREAALIQPEPASASAAKVDPAGRSPYPSPSTPARELRRPKVRDTMRPPSPPPLEEEDLKPAPAQSPPPSDELVQPKPKHARSRPALNDFVERPGEAAFRPAEEPQVSPRQAALYNIEHEAHLAPFFAGELGAKLRHWAHSPSEPLPKKDRPTYHLTLWELRTGVRNYFDRDLHSFVSYGGRATSCLFLLEKLKDGVELSGKAWPFRSLNQFEDDDAEDYSDEQQRAESERLESDRLIDAGRAVTLKNEDILGLEYRWDEGLFVVTQLSMFRLNQPRTNADFSALYTLLQTASFANIRGQRLESAPAGATYVENALRAMTNADWDAAVARRPTGLLPSWAELSRLDALEQLTTPMCDALFSLLPDTPFLSKKLLEVVYSHLPEHCYRPDPAFDGEQLKLDRARHARRWPALTQRVRNYLVSAQYYSEMTGPLEHSCICIPHDKDKHAGVANAQEYLRQIVVARSAKRGDGLELKAGQHILIAGEGPDGPTPWIGEIQYFFQVRKQPPWKPDVRVHVRYFLPASEVWFAAQFAPPYVLYAIPDCDNVFMSDQVVSRVDIRRQLAPPPSAHLDDDVFFCTHAADPDTASAAARDAVEHTSYLPEHAADLLSDKLNNGDQAQPFCFGCAKKVYERAVQSGPFAVERGFNWQGDTYSSDGCFVYIGAPVPMTQGKKKSSSTSALKPEDGLDQASQQSAEAVKREPLRIGWLLPYSKKSLKQDTTFNVIYFLRKDDIIDRSGQIRSSRELVELDGKPGSIQLSQLRGTCFVEHKSSLMKHFAADLDRPDEEYNLTIALDRHVSEPNSFFVDSTLGQTHLGRYAVDVRGDSPHFDPRSLRKLKLEPKLEQLSNSEFERKFGAHHQAVTVAHLAQRAERVRALKLASDERRQGVLQSLYTGAGALDTALCGTNPFLKLSWAVEKVAAPVRALKHNHPGATVLEMTVSDVNERVLSQLEPNAPHKILAMTLTPPCCSFSLANVHKDGMDTRQLEPLVALDTIISQKPAIAVFENVVPILSAPLPGPNSVKGALAKAVLTGLVLNGYTFNQSIDSSASRGSVQRRHRWLTNAAQLGIPLPQLPECSHSVRERPAHFVIDTSTPADPARRARFNRRFADGHAPHRAADLGNVLEDLRPFEQTCPAVERALAPPAEDRSRFNPQPYRNAGFGYPNPVPYENRLPLNDATRRARIVDPWREGGPPIAEEVEDHYSPASGERFAAALHHIPVGGNYASCPDSLQLLPPRASKQGWLEDYGNGWMKRLKWDELISTLRTQLVVSDHGPRIHPEQHRLLSVRELARVQGLPDHIAFRAAASENTIRMAIKMVGNGVDGATGSAVGRAQFEALCLAREQYEHERGQTMAASGHSWPELQQYYWAKSLSQPVEDAFVEMGDREHATDAVGAAAEAAEECISATPATLVTPDESASSSMIDLTLDSDDDDDANQARSDQDGVLYLDDDDDD